MKHNIPYGLAAILILSLFSGCDESSNSTPDATTQVQPDTIASTNSISIAEIQVEKKKNKKRMQLSADPGIDEILLHWEAVKKTTKYVLRWGMSKDDMDERITLNADETQFLHTELEPATTYYYRIKAKYGKKMILISAAITAVYSYLQKTPPVLYKSTSHPEAAGSKVQWSLFRMVLMMETSPSTSPMKKVQNMKSKDVSPRSCMT